MTNCNSWNLERPPFRLLLIDAEEDRAGLTDSGHWCGGCGKTGNGLKLTDYQELIWPKRKGSCTPADSVSDSLWSKSLAIRGPEEGRRSVWF